MAETGNLKATKPLCFVVDRQDSSAQLKARRLAAQCGDQMRQSEDARDRVIANMADEIETLNATVANMQGLLAGTKAI